MCNNENYENSSISNSSPVPSYCLVNTIENNNSSNSNSIKLEENTKEIQICDEKTIEIDNNNIIHNRNCNNNSKIKSSDIKTFIPLWNLDISTDHQQDKSTTEHITSSEEAVITLNQKDQQEISHQKQSISSLLTTTTLSSKIMLGNGVIPPGLLPPLEHYRLQLYNYAMVERLRCSQYHNANTIPVCPPGYSNTAAAAAAAAVNNPYGSRFAFSMSLFHNRVFQPEEPKPQHSYIGLIAMAILSSPESKLVLSDIYQHILDNYPYFRTRGPGWRNSIRHNLSLNDCFIKAGRSANGKGHYWAIHPANLEDFKKGDFRRRKAQRKVRKHMGLAVDDEGTDSPSPPALAVTPPPHPPSIMSGPFCPTSWAAAAVVASGTPTAGVMANIYSQSRKRQFDVASLLAPDEDNSYHQAARYLQNEHHLLRGPAPKRLSLPSSNDIDEYIDVVASDVEDSVRQLPPNKKPDEDDKNCNHNVPLIQSTSTIKDKITLRDDREIQLGNDETTIDSPISNQMDDEIPLSSSSSGPTTWQGLIQQWPNNLNSLGISGTANSVATTTMDPRVLGRYYGQYIAAAAAQQMVASRRTISVGNINSNHSFPSNENAMNINVNINNSGATTNQNQNNKILINENNNNSGNYNSEIRSHHQHQQQGNDFEQQQLQQQQQTSNDLLGLRTSDC